MWERLFNELKNKKDIQRTLDQIFSENEEAVLVNLIDRLWMENRSNKNGLTGENAIPLNAFLFINNPENFLSCVSLSHRFQIIKAFDLADPIEQKTYGERIVFSNRIIIEGFKKKYGFEVSPRELTDFLYSPDGGYSTNVRIYWRKREEKNDPSETKSFEYKRQPSQKREATVVSELTNHGAPQEVAAFEDTNPVPTIGDLKAARTTPISVSPNTEISRATSIMFQNDFSQLPVMQGVREVRGLISWKSIGEAAKSNKKCQFVHECMDRDIDVVGDDTPLLKAMQKIMEKEVVLVKSTSREIVGLVTMTDVTLWYHSLTEPFLLIGEIENHLRRLITAAGYSTSVFQELRSGETGRKIESVYDMNFGDYLGLLENPKHFRSIPYDDRSTFVAHLDTVRRIRNQSCTSARKPSRMRISTHSAERFDSLAAYDNRRISFRTSR
jgi:CBS domain-containing protein